jgi:hypothetical protein
MRKLLAAIAVPIVILLAGVHSVSAQGIQRLTETTYRQAISGKGPVCDRVEPMRAAIMAHDEEAAARHYAEFLPNRPPAGDAPAARASDLFPILSAAAAPAATWDTMFRFFQDEWPYRTQLLSPYCELSARVAEASRLHRRFVAEPFSPSAAQFVLIHVGLNSYFDKADSIKGLRLRRNGQVIEPSKTELTPETVGEGSGRRELLTGRFWFPVEAFAPGSTVTLIYVGPTRTWEWTVSEKELSALQ